MPPVERRNGVRARRTLLALLIFASTAFKILDASVPPAPIRRFGSVSGSFQLVDAKSHLPAQVTLRALEPLVPYPGRQPKRRLFRCPVRSGGAWTCQLPPATYELAVGAEGFVPQRRSGVVVLPGRDRELGTFVLEPSNAIAGTIEAEDLPFSRLDPTLAIIRVAPRAGTQTPNESVYQGDPLLVERAVGRDGSFRISGVAPGRWSVEVTYPGYLRATREPVEVAAGKTTVIGGPLLLQHAVDVELVIRPPFDPSGNPWTVHFGRVQRSARGISRDPATAIGLAGEPEQGIFTTPQLRPGRFWVSVEGSSSDAAYYARDDLEILNAADGRVEIRLAALKVEGKVRLGDAPAPYVKVTFTSPDGAYSSYFISDRDGHYEGSLAGGFGRSIVEAKLNESWIPMTFWLDVQPDGPEHATVDLRLPVTHLFGRVVDENGGPLEDARVRLLAPGVESYRVRDDTGIIDHWVESAGLFMKAHEDGEFDFVGLPEGTVKLRAYADSSQTLDGPVSDEVEVEIEDGREAGPITLRLRSPKTLRGRTLRRGEAVAGVAVKAYGDGDVSDDGTSDAMGDFEVGLPQDLARAQLLLIPPGGALRARAIGPALRLGSFEVETEGGTVSLSLPSPVGTLTAAGQALEIEQDGVWIPTLTLLLWSEELGSATLSTNRRPVFLDLAPAHYRACLGPLGLAECIDRKARQSGELRCTEGDLKAGGELTLDLVE